MKLKRLLAFFVSAGALSMLGAQAQTTVVVTEDIASGTTVEWTADKEYLLNTVVYVHDGATLNIEAGTVVRGGTNPDNLEAREGIPNKVSALWVARGGTLNAVGTAEAPIIFTAEGDNLVDTYTAQDTGLWGGVVILGRARINSSKDTDGSAATPMYDRYEGTSTEVDGTLGAHLFGGDDDEDSSGTLKYVSIRHAGFQFALNAELNGLTMGGVGSGTTVEYVEVYAGSDDGFEWWGGTVNGSHLISAFVEDDDFDTDQGYTGTLSYIFGIKPTWDGTTDSRGFESDGDLAQGAAGEEPIGQWTAWNATLIGRGKENVDFGGGVGWNTRDESAPKVYDSVFSDFAQGLRLDADGLDYFETMPPLAEIQNNIWDVADQANDDGDFIFTTAEFNNSVESAMLGGVSYTADGTLDPRPQAGSPVYANVAGSAGYRGAFSGPTDDWADGWSALSTLGFLKPAEEEFVVDTETILVDLENNVFGFGVQTQVGKTYQVYSTDSINVPFQPVGDPIPGTGDTVPFVDEIVGDAAYYYVEEIE